MRVNGESRHPPEKLSQHVFWVFSPVEKRFVYLSPSYERIFGRSREEIAERPDARLEAIHPADRDRVLSASRDGSGAPYQYEYRIVRPDGGVRWIWDRVFPVRDERGEVSRLVGIAVDVTARKRAETAVRKREELFHQLMENVQDEVLWIYSAAEQRFQHVSDAFEEIWGVPRARLYEDPAAFFERIEDPDRDRVRQALASDGDEPVDLAFRLRRPDGRTRSIALRGLVAHGEAGGPRVFGLARDVTEIESAREALRLSEESFRQLAGVLEDRAVWIYAPAERRLVYASPSCAALWGRTPTDPEAAFGESLHPDDRARVLAGRNQPPSECFDQKYRVVRPDGAVHWLRDRVSVLRNPRGEVERLVGIASASTAERPHVASAGTGADAQLRFLLSAMPIALFTCRASGDYGITFVSETARSLTGYSAPELVEESTLWLRRVHPEDAPRVVSELLTAAERGKLTHEYRFRHRNGSYRWLRATVQRAGDGRGPGSALLGCWMDIDAQKRADLGQHAAREQLRQVAHHLRHAAFSVLSADEKRVLHASPAHEELFARARAAGAKDLWSAVHPEDRERLRAGTPGRRERDCTFEYRVTAAQGEVRWVRTRSTPVRDPNGEVRRIVWITEDITDRVRAEEALRLHEEERRFFAEHLPDRVLWAASPEDQRMLYLGPAYESIWGWPRSTVTTCRSFWLTGVHPDDRARVAALFERFAGGDPATQSDYRIVRPDGTIRRISQRLLALRDARGQVCRWLGIAEDVTQGAAADARTPPRLDVVDGGAVAAKGRGLTPG
jgi:PAS domain S-box-containing protein